MNDEYSKRIEAQDLTKEPPTEEPDRQYYFMKKCREIVKKKSEELGRPLTCNLTSFGCPLYTRDSEYAGTDPDTPAWKLLSGNGLRHPGQQSDLRQKAQRYYGI